MSQRRPQLRILLTADTVGGVWTYAIDLCRTLAAHDVHVLLATMGDAPSSPQRKQALALPNVQLEASTYKLEWMDDPWADVAEAGRWLQELAAEFQPDVVHLNGFAHGDLAWNAPVLMVAHSCVCSWWRAVKHEPPPPQWENYRRAVTAGLQRADMLIAPSHAMLRSIEQNYHPAGGVEKRVIYNAADPSRYQPASKQPVIFSAGRLWDEAKNLATLAAAAADLPWQVHVAGSNASPDGRQVQSENVRLLGHLTPDVLARQLSCASIYALPARYEPFGLSVLEAALSGCALVLGDIPSLREVWGDAANFVPPDDPIALRKVLMQLIEQPEERAAWAGRAQRRAAHFTPHRMGAAYLAAYRHLLSPVAV